MHKEMQKKLVMVSILVDGARRVKFAHLSPDNDGKFRIPEDERPGIEEIRKNKRHLFGG